MRCTGLYHVHQTVTPTYALHWSTPRPPDGHPNICAALVYTTSTRRSPQRMRCTGLHHVHQTVTQRTRCTEAYTTSTRQSPNVRAALKSTPRPPDSHPNIHALVYTTSTRQSPQCTRCAEVYTMSTRQSPQHTRCTGLHHVHQTVTPTYALHWSTPRPPDSHPTYALH